MRQNDNEAERESGRVEQKGIDVYSACMAFTQKDNGRDERIRDEIVVDAHDSEERAMGWYYYLDDVLDFPFKARCIEKRPASPLVQNEIIQVLGMAIEKECEHEMFVDSIWNKRKLAVPLAQIHPIDGSEKTKEAIDDWHYWVREGYEF
ncbi:MAG: Calcium binding protein from Anabaena CcbP [Parcubacteria group bacterium Gr01-1014_48]|nr:MAG: Calcium binding protein from Anabaena CcbP [Parcubacteria group bacterium Greene0416_14]TSC72914.1 MAG: Calcium binding protein from Anabaena CcbP [Parcubacteria group bacterium Gr01-1014_48]TSD00542.1 MAG: Calcium binding protein from Anabaena CcbP [Parcubacteria group bacterium Greene1014_15]TSD07768.1 MAG: Calcium binding protein from Anabaena CcbP [Parcubacteria group bacterium Greene0714_4]